MTVASIYEDLVIFGLLLLAGFAVREIIKPIRKLYLPASLIGGAIGLILGPQICGIIPQPESFSSFSGTLINLMLTGIVFGVVINKDKVTSYLDYSVANQSVYGMQMTLGPVVGLLLATIWTSLPESWGIMGLYAFHGGHGTAATAGALFEELGVADNQTAGAVLATIGLIVAMTIGMAVVNFGIRKGWAKYVKEPQSQPAWALGGPLPKEKRTSIGTTVTNSIGINHLALQLSWLFLSYFVGKWLIKGLTMLWPAASNIPSMLYGILGAMIVWPLLKKLKLDCYVDKQTISQLCSLCMEIIVLTVVATLNLKFLAANIVPILIYSVILVAMTLFLSFYLPYRFAEDEWFEKGCMIFGHTTGTGATGFALLRAVDPESKSSVGDAHGVYSALSCWQNALPAVVPIWMMSGIALTVGVGGAMLVACLIVGFGYFARRKAKRKKEDRQKVEIG
ncbi:sodium/glutamate symporter [Feifania hominis]|uniref:Sodium:glutamate symporter n=1 Tax=Feifania hominis TaxID=2763660 RepID=A0A926DG41_9FIRM|nr:sodium/glutamate symporter [Feifania hominis]MBC8536415.1 sodium:glutamate symporter [Feifania hominis]